MKNSEILELVKKRIKSKIGPGYICHQIHNIISERVTNIEDLSTSSNLRNWVCRLIVPYPTYECWLQYTHPRKYAKWINAKSPVAARVQWLDWMIHYWQRQERKSAK